MQIASGCLLIANPVLRDPNFRRTVVLMCEHSSEGSMGLVVNRRTPYTLGEALSESPGDSDQPLYWGGPVQTEMVLVLHTSLGDAPLAKPIADGVALSADSETLMQILGSSRHHEQRTRVFAGYAGWGAGQLEREMTEHSWLVIRARPRLIFELNAEQIWEEALKLLGPAYAHLASMPEDPRVN